MESNFRFGPSLAQSGAHNGNGGGGQAQACEPAQLQLGAFKRGSASG